MKTAFLAILISLISCFDCGFAQQNIVETASAAGNFNTLLAAAKAAGLADALASGQYTVFAPTDEAFGRVDLALIQDLLRPENKSKLAAFLKYHVVPGSVSAIDAYPLSNAATLNGQRISLALDALQPTVGNANLLKTDIVCSNGIIHVIDSVLLPSGSTIPEVATSAGNIGTLLAAASAAGLSLT